MSTTLFSNSEIKLLQDFHSPRYYPPEELASLQQLLTFCIGNMTANKAMDELCSKTREDKIDPTTQRFIRNLFQVQETIDDADYTTNLTNFIENISFKMDKQFK